MSRSPSSHMIYFYFSLSIFNSIHLFVSKLIVQFKASLFVILSSLFGFINFSLKIYKKKHHHFVYLNGIEDIANMQ